MANLYTWVEEPRDNPRGPSDQIRETLSVLHATAGYFPGAQGDDWVAALFETIFPDGMLAAFLAANTSLDPTRILLALRPALREGRTWPFPPGRSLCVRGWWYPSATSPIFLVRSVMEISDAPLRPFERELEVFTYWVDPRRPDARRQRPDNVLTLELAASLPAISRRTEERLVDWNGYLT